MRILQLYNQYRSLRSGEEKVVFDIMTLLQKMDIEAKLLMLTSRGLDKSLIQKMKAGLVEYIASLLITKWIKYLRNSNQT